MHLLSVSKWTVKERPFLDALRWRLRTTCCAGILKASEAAAHGEREDLVTRVYRRGMTAILHKTPLRWGFLASVGLLLLGSVSLFYFQFVKVKMLPFDNKSEFQVIVDMPNGTTLEETARVAGELARAALDQPEVVNLQTYAGTASPFNFNGLVRHYCLRRGSNIAILDDISPANRPAGRRPRPTRQAGPPTRPCDRAV
jgi:multidrug efflux pump subunit AcrB